MNNGFVIMAQNTEKVNYVECAEVLSSSIKRVMPDANVTIITTDMLPYGDLAPDSDWKLINDWQVYEASPYEYTIKLEADMFIPVNIDYWWDILKDRNVCVSTNIRDYKGKLSSCRYYRRFIDNNKLPDVYNALTYFKKSDTAETFFNLVRNVFENWEEYKSSLQCNVNEIVTTDWAYSIACAILGEENTTMHTFNQFSMVHMKQFVNDTITEDWTNELIYEFTEPLKIQTFPQLYPVHYYTKDFAKKLKESYA
jgi:hypothetical protein